jgi:hypothetical protein
VGNGDVLDIVVHKNVRLSEIIVSDNLDSDHLPIVFHLLGHIRIRKHSNPIEKFTGWERFQSLTSELISPRIQTNSGEADKGIRDFPASIASAYRLSRSKIRLPELNKDLPGLKGLLKHKRRLRRLWQVTPDAACKAAVNWVAKTFRRLTRRKALELWETKLCNCEATPQALWPIAKSLMKKTEPRLFRNDLASEEESQCASGLFRKSAHIE